MTDVRIIDLAPRGGAGFTVWSRWTEVKATIQQGFARVYAPGALVAGHGHNFVLYTDETAEGGLMTTGVLDRQPGGADAAVKPVDIPGGRTITATHWGDYGAMRTTYDALHAAVKARGLTRIWSSLEVYGDWYDDLTKVRTDIYLYLAGS